MVAMMATANVWADDEVVTPPADLQTEVYVAILTAGDQTYYQNVNVGFYGEDEVYMQGLAYNGVPESWVKGTLTDGMFLTIPSCPLGSFEYMGMTYTYIFNGTTFIYTASTGEFYGPAGYSISGGIGSEVYATARLRRLVEKAAVPATPTIVFQPSVSGSTYVVEMTIPLVDVNGDPLVSDKLSYMLFYEKEGTVSPLTFTKDKYRKLTEDMTEIPYNFTDRYDIDNYEIWMNQGKTELESWSKIGLQSIYRGGDEENKSEIAWFDLDAFWGHSGIDSPLSPNTNHPTAIYNLNGQQLQNLQRGINIIGGKKVVVK
jgi:hypothetical protein